MRKAKPLLAVKTAKVFRWGTCLVLVWLVATAGASEAQKGDTPEKGTVYSPIGKRDPFKAPLGGAGRDLASTVNPLERFAIAQLQLRAIIKADHGEPKAMFEDPEGASYIVGQGEIIGREHGTISRILDKGVVVTERTFNYLGAENLYEKVISLPQK
jgi:Tfp pilus assembly protein PilP